MTLIRLKFLFKHLNRFCLYLLVLNCIILFQSKQCLSETIDATVSSLNLDDSIDQSTSTIQNSNNNQETVIANSTGNLINTNDQNYYVSSLNELSDNETNSNPIVISNNVSTNKLQQLKPNTTFDNRIVETINDNQNKQIYNDILNSNYVSPSSNLEFKNLESITSSTTNKSILKNQYEYLNVPTSSNNFQQSNQFNSQTQSKNSQLSDDLIEFRLNGSTSFSKFLDKTTSIPSTTTINSNLPTLSTPISNQITQTPSTIVNEKVSESIIDSMPELYAPLSSFANSLQQANQKQKLNNDKNNLLLQNTTPKNIPLNNLPSTTNNTSAEHYSNNLSENRLRWINNYNHRNKLPPYPPKQPNIPGIPSGFRNPIGSNPQNTLPPSNNIIPSGMLNGVSTPPLNSGTNSAPYLNPTLNNILNNSGTNLNSPNNINLASIVNSLTPNNIHQPSGFGGSSLGSLNPAAFPYPTANNLIGPPSIFATSGYPGNGMVINPNLSPEVEAEIEAGLASATHSFSRRPGVNITRVEHIAAECSDDYMKVIINFNGTFTGLVYSSGYVHDANCIYVNGTGRNGYEFYIRLNQCGTMGREEMHHPKRPGEVRRRDQVMWNTLSIQYNGMIEEEFDEHYRVTCEYGSDYWKTVTFPSFNVEVNTGSPVEEMEVRRGFGIAGSRTSGPVTVGDPLTLLIHMKSEKAGFDILVKNCISHNGGNQRLQLIDTNGCVTNEKLISPFRGTYNSDDGHQVTLYAYLKAFRFTGSPALYLECDIHSIRNKF